MDGCLSCWSVTRAMISKNRPKVTMRLVVDPLLTPSRIIRIAVDVVGPVGKGLLPFLCIFYRLLSISLRQECRWVLQLQGIDPRLLLPRGAVCSFGGRGSSG